MGIRVKKPSVKALKQKKDKYSNMISWLLSIPECELSDDMIRLYADKEKNNYSTQWLEFQILDKCQKELDDLIEWNDSF
jgi:hypothetical protein